MPSEHARLSPSSAERWISCPASVTMAEQVHTPQVDSPYAAEGTTAHALAEIEASIAFGLIDGPTYTARYDEWRATVDAPTAAEMHRHADAYVELLGERMALYPGSQLLLEQRLNTGVPGCWGTSDAVIVSPQHVEIVDFKYGAGLAVEAEGNPQLRLYALGALDTYGDILGDTEVVRMTVHQPRMHHVLTEELTPAELRAWRTTVVAPAAVLVNSEEPPFGPSEAACRWCPVSGKCKAQLEDVFSTPFEEDPALLPPAQVGEVLAKVPAIKKWLKAFEAAALDMAYSDGQQVPGFKVVTSGGRRVINDVPGAIEALVRYGYDPDTVAPRRVNGIGDLERLLGDKDTFDTLLGAYVVRTEGRPSLVPESDRRRPISPNTEAQQAFGPVAD